MSQFIIRGAAVLGLLVLVPACSGNGASQRASDQYVPTITVDGKPLLFPPGTQTSTDLPAEQSCRQAVNDDVTLQWVGYTTPKETTATNPYGLRSSVKVEIAAVTPVARPGIEEIEIVVDNKISASDKQGPDAGRYSAYGDYSQVGGSLKHVSVTKTSDGYEIRADDAKWQYPDARIHSDVHPITIEFTCRK